MRVEDPLALRVRVESDLAAIGRNRWDGLVHPSPYLSYGWLRARSRTIKGSNHFILVSTADQTPLLGIPCYLVHGSSHPGYDPAQVLAPDDLADEDVALQEGGGQALSELRATLRHEAGTLHPALVVSVPGRLGGVSYGPAIDRDSRHRAVEVGIDAVERVAEADSARTICWLYLVEGEDDILADALHDRGYLSVVVDAESYLPVAWDDFDGYLASFKSQRRRQIRLEMAAFSAAGVQVELRDADALGPDLARLELQWRNKYGRTATYGETLAEYRELPRHVADALRIFVASRAGHPLGFTVFLEEGRTWYARFGGFDYSAGRLYLYFNLLFYHPLQAAIDLGIASVRYSLKSHETKRSRGCLLRNVLAYVRLPQGMAGRMQPGLRIVDHGQRLRFARIGAMHSRCG